MRILLCRWPWFILAILVGAMAWALYEILPIEPRWRLALDDVKFGRPEFFWEPGGSRVRLFGRDAWPPRIADGTGSTIFFEPPPRGSAGPVVLDVASGRIASKLPDHAAQVSFTHSPDGRYGVGIL